MRSTLHEGCSILSRCDLQASAEHSAEDLGAGRWAHATGEQECIDRPAIFPVRPIRIHGRAEMIQHDAVGARRNDVDFVCQLSAA